MLRVLTYPQLERFSELLSRKAQSHTPCELAMGYRSLFLKISNDFIFSDVPDEFKSLKSEAFDDPLTIATYGAINWTVWFSRNFPKLQVLVSSIPRSFLSRFTGAFEPTLDVTDVSVWL